MGGHERLPTGLRIGSAVSLALYAVSAVGMNAISRSRPERRTMGTQDDVHRILTCLNRTLVTGAVVVTSSAH